MLFVYTKSLLFIRSSCSFSFSFYSLWRIIANIRSSIPVVLFSIFICFDSSIKRYMASSLDFILSYFRSDRRFYIGYLYLYGWPSMVWSDGFSGRGFIWKLGISWALNLGCHKQWWEKAYSSMNWVSPIV